MSSQQGRSARPFSLPPCDESLSRRPVARYQLTVGDVVSGDAIALRERFTQPSGAGRYDCPHAARSGGAETRYRRHQALRSGVSCAHGGVRIVECTASTIDGFLSIDG